MNSERLQLLQQAANRFARRLHRDERGALSVMGVFTLFMLTVLLGMIFNMGKQVDDKLRMQNAADAATYSGTRTLTRGMNAIAYSNHLLCEIFALTAYMREAQLEPNSSELAFKDTLGPDPEDAADFGNGIASEIGEAELEAADEFAQTNGQSFDDIFAGVLSDDYRNRYGLAPDVDYEDTLTVWEDVARRAFQEMGREAGLLKFEALGQAILNKLEHEKRMVRTFEPLAREHARLTLAVFEYVLRGDEGFVQSFPVRTNQSPQVALEGGLITRFQRMVLRHTPTLAQWVAQEVAERHGEGHEVLHPDAMPVAALYRMTTDSRGQRFGYTRLDEAQSWEEYRDSRTLPVIDPTVTGGDLREISLVPEMSGRLTTSFDPKPGYHPDSLSVDQRYFKLAYDTREAIAERYLDQLIFNWMDIYFTERRSNGNSQGFFGRDRASLSQLANYWRMFSCGHLRKLLDEEFPSSNLPMLIRSENPEGWRFHPEALNADGVIENFYGNVWFDPRNTNDPHSPELHDHYHVVGVVAWTPIELYADQFYDHPLDEHYPVTFAQAKMFLPFRMLNYPWVIRGSDRFGVPYEYLHTNGWPSGLEDWSMMNQNWRTKLVPVSSVEIANILQHPIEVDGPRPLERPDLSGMTLEEIRILNSH